MATTSLNLTIHAPASGTTAESLRAYLLTQPRYQLEGDDISYINQDTGVFFLIEVMWATKPSGTMPSLDLQFRIMYGNAEFFGLEAFAEIERVCSQQSLLLRAPHKKTPQKYTARQLHDLWLPINDEVLARHGKFPPDGQPMAYVPRQQANQLWQYCYQRQALQEQLGEATTVQEIHYYCTDDGQLVTSASWLAGAPVVVPKALDYAYYNAIKKRWWIFPYAAPTGHVPFARIKEIVGADLQSLSEDSYQISEQDAAKYAQRIAALPVMFGVQDTPGTPIGANKIIDIEVAQPSAADAPEDDEAQQGVVITLKLSDDAFGTESERDAVYLLEDALEEVLSDSDADVDGHDFGGGEASVYIYGPSADKIFKAIKPELSATSFKAVSVLLRYGAVDDEDAKQKTIQLR